MTATNITIPMGRMNVTGIQFMTYAKRYRRAALSVRSIADKRGSTLYHISFFASP